MLTYTSCHEYCSTRDYFKKLEGNDAGESENNEPNLLETMEYENRSGSGRI